MPPTTFSANSRARSPSDVLYSWQGNLCAKESTDGPKGHSPPAIDVDHVPHTVKPGGPISPTQQANLMKRTQDHSNQSGHNQGIECSEKIDHVAHEESEGRSARLSKQIS
jgi:hypothetical protein